MKNKLLDELKKSNEECLTLLEKTKTDAKSVMDGIQEEYRKNVTESVPREFGEYLYNALGTKINSQRKVVLNQDYIDKQDYMTKATDIEMSLEDYLKHIAKPSGYYHKGERQNFSYITTGKRFGFSYYTDTGKLYTKFITADQLFYFLTQEHVNLICNKAKRACAQEFLNLRDNYVAKLEAIRKVNIEKPIDVQMARISRASLSNKYSKDGYAKDKTSYLITESIKVESLDRVLITTPLVTSWDKITKPEKSDFEYGSNDGVSISLYALMNPIKDSNKHRVCGDFIYDYESSRSGVANCAEANVSSVCNADMDTVSKVLKDFEITTEDPNAGYYHRNYCENYTKLVLDWDVVLNHTDVQNALNDIVTFYNTAAKALHTLKKRHAGLIFVNGIF